jgi:methylenetetrahydrofolate dehydrogenase (NADP+)/methenyltetrahydrofolate cyclohydrolase
MTPVPGGVGPMTIAVLLAQTVDAAARQLIRHPGPGLAQSR